MKLFLSVLTLILLAGGLLGFNPGGRRYHLMSPISRPEQVLLSRITELAELTVLVVPVSTVLTTELVGYTGSARCIVVVNGEAELGVDLEQARFADIDAEARTATLILPEPRTRAARLDHARTQIYSLDRQGLWLLLSSGESCRLVVNQAMQQAQAAVEAAGQDTKLLYQAREQAERALGNAIETVGWQLHIVWAGGPWAADETTEAPAHPGTRTLLSSGRTPTGWSPASDRPPRPAIRLDLTKAERDRLIRNVRSLHCHNPPWFLVGI